MQDHTLMVVHVPKAAGTTLRWILDRQYQNSQVFKIRGDIVGDQRILKQLADDEKRKLKAVFGHFCYGLHDALAPGQLYAYVTMLRDPVQRLASLYAYVSRPTTHYLYEPTKGMSFAKFVVSGVTRISDNGQVRQLCGMDKFTMKDGKQTPYDDMVIPFGQVTREHLEMAKANLDTFVCVGVAERFDDFLTRMETTFAWRIPMFGNQNVTARKPKVTEGELDIARKLSILDYELYEYAEKLAKGEQPK